MSKYNIDKGIGRILIVISVGIFIFFLIYFLNLKEIDTFGDYILALIISIVFSCTPWMIYGLVKWIIKNHQ